MTVTGHFAKVIVSLRLLFVLGVGFLEELSWGLFLGGLGFAFFWVVEECKEFHTTVSYFWSHPLLMSDQNIQWLHFTLQCSG